MLSLINIIFDDNNNFKFWIVIYFILKVLDSVLSTFYFDVRTSYYQLIHYLHTNVEFKGVLTRFNVTIL